MDFGFEKLDVYQRGLNFVESVFELTEKLSREIQYSLGDQLRRASLSIVNNIAEGSDRPSNKEKERFYELALGSARECAPMLELVGRRKLFSQEDQSKLREECVIICKMLSKLKQSIANNKLK